MDNVLTQISKISDRIDKSQNYGYLYQYYYELIALLDSNDIDKLSPIIIRDLKGLIQDMATESTCNKFVSSNRIIYSAELFCCADNLVQYLPKDQREFFYGYLNGIFTELMESGIAPIIEKVVFERYLRMNLTAGNGHKIYENLISKAICECAKCRLRCEDEVSLACVYTKSINNMIRAYVKEYEDFSMLKEWIPKLRISHAVKHRNSYPESTWFESARDYEQKAVMESLNQIVQIQGYLHCLWYWHTPEELISALSTEELIDMFEAFDDRAFDDILCNITEFKNNSKVKDVLLHFAGHTDKVIAELARQLLDNYQNNI